MEKSDRESNYRKGSSIAGLSAAGALLTGAGGLFGSFLAAGNGEFLGGGIYLFAAATAFGLLANAMFRR